MTWIDNILVHATSGQAVSRISCTHQLQREIREIFRMFITERQERLRRNLRKYLLAASTFLNLFTLSRTAKHLSTFLEAAHIPDLLLRIENEGC